MRSARDQTGFTLIELMVVVLIVGILITIAIPTYLGQRTRAEDRGTQGTLRNALVAAKSFFSDGDSYSGFTTAVGTTTEPSIDWQPNVVALAGGTPDKSVALVQASGGDLLLVALSGSNTYFGIGDQANAPGTSFCKSPAAPGWTVAGNCSGGW